MRAEINWRAIAEAIDFYAEHKFEYVEVPWVVSHAAIYATLPKDKQPFRTQKQSFLVGSAEQSFLQMMLEGKLPHGKFVTASPCFRDDDVDQLHFKDFFKVELIHRISSLAPTHIASLTDIMMQSAVHFFSSRMSGKDSIQIVRTDIGSDICINGIEVGSYGYRTYYGYDWIYGTGLAEPRLSQALARSR